MSSTIKMTFGDPGDGTGLAFSRDCLLRSPAQSPIPSVATIATADGKLNRTNRRKAWVRRSMSGINRMAIPSKATSNASP